MAVDMFLKLEGITGEAKDSVHAGEIDILAWSWGASNSGTSHMGGGAGAGKVNVQDISVTKYVDLASAALLLHCCNGGHIAEATLTVRKAGTNPLEYIVIKMEQVLVCAYSTGGSGGEDRLTENVTLNFAKVAFDYLEQKPDGTEGEKGSMTWDIPANIA